jgi:diguanylate cyclase (GGDEF)-like protein/PAS domain S-box-containing protein
MNGVEGLRVADRAELLESALDTLGEAAGLSDLHGHVVFWNRAAEGITGYHTADVIGRRVRDLLELMVVGGSSQWVRTTELEASGDRGSMAHLRHALGYEIQVFARVITLRDGMGSRIGSAVLFHPADNIDSLPHGESNHARISESQMQLEDRLSRLHEDFDRGDLPLGVLWISVDQGPELRGSHGSRACEAMLESMERTLASGLKPTEEIGRWGVNDFLVLSHERNAAALLNHARMLAGLARTAEFRWWGDRISLTVSVGAAMAEQDESLSALLERAQSAMQTGIRAGGNQVSDSQGRG